MNPDLRFYRKQRLENLAKEFDRMLSRLDAEVDDVETLPFYNQQFINKLCEAMEEEVYTINVYKHFEKFSPERSLGLENGTSLKVLDCRIRHLDLMRELHDFHTFTDEKRRLNFYYRTFRDYWNSTRPLWHFGMSRL